MTTISTPKVSRGLRGLRNSSFSNNSESVEAERDALLSEIAHLEQWWSDERWNGTKRTYSAADVVSLRPSPSARPGGTLSPKCSYSNASSRKLYSLLTSLHSVGGYSHTFGALDPIQAVQMAPRELAFVFVCLFRTHIS